MVYIYKCTAENGKIYFLKSKKVFKNEISIGNEIAKLKSLPVPPIIIHYVRLAQI